MKTRMGIYTRMILLMFLVTSGSGCAQPYPPRQYYATISTPHFPTQPPVPDRTPLGRYQATYHPGIRHTRVAEERAAGISRQANRRIAENEARARRRADEIEAKVRQQTAEIQRRVARQTKTALRQTAQSAWGPSAPRWEIDSWPDEEISVAAEDVWEIRLSPTVNIFSNIQTDVGFVPHVLATDTRALFIWPLASADDARNAAMNLVAVKNELQRLEPDAVVEMVLLADNGQVRAMSRWESQGIRCLDAAQFASFAERFFAPSNEQGHSRNGTSLSMGVGGTGKESPWETMLAKVRESTLFVTNFMETEPWWVWAIGAVLIFVVVFSACARDTNTHTSQTQDEDPWVMDPSGH